MLPVLLAAAFQLVHPLPVADTLRDVHVMDDGQVWIVGDHGTVLRIDRTPTGPTLTRITVPAVPTVASVFDALDRSMGSTNASPSSVEFPGSQYMPLGFESIAATGPKDVWLALGTESLARWDGAAWTWHKDSDTDAGDALMLDAAGELWTWGGFGMVFGATGHAPRILGKTSGTWTFRDGPVAVGEKRVRSLARQGEDVWAAGFDGALLRSHAGAPFEQRKPPGDDRESFWSLWLDETGTAGLLGAQRSVYVKRGDTFVPGPETGGSVADVFGFPGGEPAWVVGDEAQILKGGVLTTVPIADYKPPDSLVFRLDGERIEAVHGRSPDDVWMVGAAGLILHWDGAELRELMPRVTEQSVVGLVWEGEEGWMAATSDGQLIHGTLGEGITSVEKGPVNSPDSLIRLASGEVLLHALCDDLFVQTSGGWRQLPEPAGCVKHVAGLSSKDLWGAGSSDLVDGKVYRLKGNKWTEVLVPTEMELYAVAVEADGTAWIGGDRVLLRAPQGKNLAITVTHEFDEYRGLAIAGPGDLWIAGNSTEIGSAGMILRWSGGALARHDNLTANYLRDLTTTPDGQVWAVGLGGVAARSTKSGFEAVDTGTGATLDHIYAHPNGTLIAIGDDGAILQRTP